MLFVVVVIIGNGIAPKDDNDNSDSRPRDPTFLTFARFSQSLIESTYKRGILDSACTKTVAGTDWMNDFVFSLSGSMKES